MQLHFLEQWIKMPGYAQTLGRCTCSHIYCMYVYCCNIIIISTVHSSGRARLHSISWQGYQGTQLQCRHVDYKYKMNRHNCRQLARIDSHTKKTSFHNILPHSGIFQLSNTPSSNLFHQQRNWQKNMCNNRHCKQTLPNGPNGPNGLFH